MTLTTATTQSTIKLLLRGLVQGQGVRPTIARIAARHGIAGTVQNSHRGVEVTASGNPRSLQAFLDDLIAGLDDASLAAEVANAPNDSGATDFQILASAAGGRVQTTIPLDLAVCPDCLLDVRSPNNRRFGYPLTTCARCGPRYSILKGMPFDREATSMAAFAMCELCETEYRDPHDRRFHAQTIACADCGPSYWATDSSGNQVTIQAEAINWIGTQIASGKIAAIKGIGGYQLICVATNDAVVNRLRERKRRPSKPLPVMVSDVAAAEALAEIGPTEQQALQAPAGAIVLLRSLRVHGVSPAVFPQLHGIGVMLPTSPLHAMLLDVIGLPLVVTSGNVHGSPLAYQNENAAAELSEIADVFLHHDREIVHPVDDSVLQCFGDRVTTIRAARGIAPLTIASQHSEHNLAVAGHQKVAPAISTTSDIVLAPFVGDMESEACRIRFQQSVDALQSLFQIQPYQIIRDEHPDYFTSSWADASE